jgi:replicative DNA helicase
VISTEKILAAALRHREVVDVLGDALKSDLVVAQPYYRGIMEFVVGFVRQHRTLPRDGDLQLWASQLPEVQRAGIIESLGKLYSQDISGYTPSHLAESVTPQLQAAAAHTALARLNSMTEVTPELFRGLAQEISRIEPVSISGLASIKDVDRWLTPEPAENYIPTGIPKLDEFIGGWRGSELVFLLADSGVGKTQSLVNFGAAAALFGGNVLHITLELATSKTLRRLYQKVTESDRSLYRQDLGEVRRRAEHWTGRMRGNLHVLEAPAYSLEPEQLAVLVDRFAAVHGPPDLIIIDYLDLLKPPGRGDNRYQDLGKVSHLVRAIALKYDCTVLTATQAVRKANTAERLTMADMGDSYEKVRAADILLSIVQTPEEAQVFQGRMGLLKVRDNPGRGQEIPLLIYHDLCYVGDLDHPNTQRLMRERGLLAMAA